MARPATMRVGWTSSSIWCRSAGQIGTVCAIRNRTRYELRGPLILLLLPCISFSSSLQVAHVSHVLVWPHSHGSVRVWPKTTVWFAFCSLPFSILPLSTRSLESGIVILLVTDPSLWWRTCPRLRYCSPHSNVRSAPVGVTWCDHDFRTAMLESECHARDIAAMGELTDWPRTLNPLWLALRVVPTRRMPEPCALRLHMMAPGIRLYFPHP